MALWLPRDAVRPVKWHATHKWPTWRMKNLVSSSRGVFTGCRIPPDPVRKEWRNLVAFTLTGRSTRYTLDRILFIIIFDYPQDRYSTKRIDDSFGKIYKILSKLETTHSPSSRSLLIVTRGPPGTWPPIRLDPVHSTLLNTLSKKDFHFTKLEWFARRSSNMQLVASDLVAQLECAFCPREASFKAWKRFGNDLRTWGTEEGRSITSNSRSTYRGQSNREFEIWLTDCYRILIIILLSFLFFSFSLRARNKIDVITKESTVLKKK